MINKKLEEAFLKGSKWQTERMYSKEEIDFIISTTWIKCIDNNGNNFKKITDKIIKKYFKNKKL